MKKGLCRLGQGEIVDEPEASFSWIGRCCSEISNPAQPFNHCHLHHHLQQYCRLKGSVRSVQALVVRPRPPAAQPAESRKQLSHCAPLLRSRAQGAKGWICIAHEDGHAEDLKQLCRRWISSSLSVGVAHLGTRL